MAEILRYVLVDQCDQEAEYEYASLEEAVASTMGCNDCAVIRRTYAYEDSELVWTPNGTDFWPARPRRRRRRK